MIILLPYVSVFSKAFEFSEQVDEMLYGDKCEIVDKKGEFCKIITDYGYTGYIKKKAINCEKYTPNYIVNLPFADLLFRDRNFFKPALSLPMGAKVHITENDESQRYFKIKLQKGEEYFIHKNHVKPLNLLPKTQEDIRFSVTQTAKSYLGVQYRWGGRTPYGVDCSGLCFNAYRFNGIDIWRDANPEKTKGLRIIPFETAKEGDLMFFKGHMAMYLGNGEIIHASASKGKVIIEKYENNSYLKEIYISTGTIF